MNLLFKILKDTILQKLILALAKEGASRTTTKWDDKAVEVIELLLKGSSIPTDNPLD